MTEFTIKGKDLAHLKGKVIVITGCSSGIGLATTELLLGIGALVVGGDLNPSPTEHPNFQYLRTSVTLWPDLSALFRAAKERHGVIDHVFANAGITGHTNYLDEVLDGNGDLMEPDHQVIDVNLRGVINTCSLAMHYMRRQETGGSIVVTASASSFQRFRVVDYATAKHGVLGFMRGMVPVLQSQNIPIRINGIAPSWTLTGIVRAGLVEAAGKSTQLPEVPAASAAILMADSTRQGQLIYSWEGRFKEIDTILLKSAEAFLDGDVSDDLVMERIYANLAGSGIEE